MNAHLQEILVDSDPELLEFVTAFLDSRDYGVYPVRERIAKASGRTARFADWTLDLARHRLSAPGGVTVSLSPTEFALLLAFLERPREVLSRAWLIEASRAKSRPFSTRTLDVYVSRLRRRLSARIGGAELIATRSGQGYVFDADVAFE